MKNRKVLFRASLITSILLLVMVLVFSFFLTYRASRIVPYSVFQETQFVGHARYYSDSLPNNSLALYKYLIDEGYRVIECDVVFTKDDVPVLCHENNLKEIAKDEHGNAVEKEISELTWEELRKYDLSISGGAIPITTFYQIVMLAKHRNVCIEVDIEKYTFSFEQCKCLYSIVEKAGMLDKVMWEVSNKNFWMFARLNQNLIYQIDHAWSYDVIDNCRKRQYVSKLIVLSQWFPDSLDGDYREIIEYAHKKGFKTKCCIVNDTLMARKLFEQGCDMITTDRIKNVFLSDIE